MFHGSGQSLRCREPVEILSGTSSLRLASSQTPAFGVNIRPEILAASDLADGKVFVAGISEGLNTLTLERESETATLPFSVRRFGDEFAYTHQVGLTFVHSDRRLRGKEWVHELEIRLFPGEPLSASSSAIAFLLLLKRGTTIRLSDRYWIPLDQWGGSATAIGPAIAGLQAIDQTLKIGLKDFRLSDLQDEEFARSLAFAYGFSVRTVPLSNSCLGFLLARFQMPFRRTFRVDRF